MPTGYTAPIEEGDLSAKSFATRCARAFGAFAHQREDRVDEPPRPVEVKVDSYYQTSLQEAQEKLERIKAMTREEIVDAWLADVHLIGTRNAEAAERYRDEVAKYQTVKRGIEAWTPNEQATALKDYCLDQLKISWPYEPHYSTPFATPEVWHAQELDSADRDVDFYETRAEEELQGLIERREFAIKVLESIEDIEEES